MVKMSRIGFSIITASLLLVGCGGGSGGISETVSNSANGLSNKGPFKKGSVVFARHIQNDGTYADGDELNTTTTDDKGSYTLSPSWSGITELRITGEYLNEATGSYMNDGNISAIVDLSGSTSAGINIFTDMASSIIKQKIKDGELNTKTFAQIKTEAQEIVQKQFNLKLDGAKLEDLDMTSSDKDANAQLMKVSAALMQTADPKKALEDLKEDISDGEVDGIGLGAVAEIKKEVKNIDVTKVADNIEANVEGANAPTEDKLDGTLSLDSTISFVDINDALPDTEYTVESNIDGVIGDSADISITGGDFTVNGKTSTQVSNGDMVKITAVSSSDYNTSKEIKVVIGGTIFPITIQTKVADRVADRTPDEFSLGYKADQEISTDISSDEVTITGIDDNTTISVKNGKYSIDGGAFVSTAGTINDGQKVKVQVTSSANFGEVEKAVLTIGNTEKTFAVITKQQDINPDKISLSPVYDVNVSTEVESDEVAVTGINTAIPISVEGALYSIDGSSFTAVPGTVNNGQKVKVKLTASSEYKDEKVAKLHIGNMIVPFHVTTMEEPKEHDTTPSPFSFSKVYTNDKEKPQEASIIVKGINEETDISITGGEYSVNGAAFTKEKSKVNLDDNVTVKVVSADYGKKSEAVLTIGGVSSTFTVVTNDDQTPEPINLKPVSDANTSTEYKASVVIQGISHPVDVSVEGDGASYLVNGVEGTSTVKNDDNLTVILESSSEPSDLKIAKVTVGKSAAVFAVKTKAPAPEFSAVTESKSTDEDALFTYTPVLTKGNVENWDINKSSLPAWLSFDKRVGKFYGIPRNSDVGSYSINLTAKNSSGEAKQTINIDVKNVNDAPTFADANKTITLDENNASMTTYSLELNATDVDVGDSVTYSVVPDSSPFVDIDLVDNNLTLSLKSGVLSHNTEKLELVAVATDKEGATAKQMISLNLIGKNNKPVFLAPPSVPGSVAEDSKPFTIALNASDSDGDSVTYTVVSSDDSIATATVDGSIMTVTPQANAYGSVTFTVKPFDGIDYGDPLNITINITPVNDKPVLSPISHPAIAEDSGTISIDLNATDVDGDTLTYEIQSVSDKVDANISGSVLNITPKKDANGVAQISVVALDGTTVSDPQTLDLTITPVNDAPVAQNISDSTDNEHPLTINVLSYVSDPDGDTLTVKSVTQPSSGSVAISDNKIIFTPNSIDTNLTTNFTYTVSDGTLEANATVTIEISEYKSALVKAVDSLDGFDPETGDIEAKLSDIRAKLNQADSDDKEAKIGLAILDLADVLNSSEVSSLVSVQLDGSSSDDYLPMILKGLTDENAQLNVVLNSISDLSGATTDILHDLSVKLQDIVKSIDDVYTDKDTVITIDGTTINKAQADVINAGALAIASNLEFLASYYYADYDDVKTIKETIDGKTVEYQVVSADPVSVLNKSTTFTISNTARLANAKTLLLSAIDRVESIDTSKLSGEDASNMADTQEKLIDVKNSLNGTALYERVSENSDGNTTVKYVEYYDLSAIYNPSTAIVLSSFGSDFAYNGTYDANISKIKNSPSDAHYNGLDIEPQNAPTSATSSLDDILKKVDVTIDGNTTTYSGDDIFGYINDDIDTDISQGTDGITFTINDANNGPYKWELLNATDGLSLLSTTGTTNTLNLNGITGNVWYNIKVTDKFGHTEWLGGDFYQALDYSSEVTNFAVDGTIHESTASKNDYTFKVKTDASAPTATGQNITLYNSDYSLQVSIHSAYPAGTKVQVGIYNSSNELVKVSSVYELSQTDIENGYAVVDGFTLP